ncbi:MAG: exosortase H-associated membrane protein [Rhodanobacteraceae bacterium]
MSADSRRLKRFLLAVVVWLPLAFLGWSVLSSALVWVPGQLSGWVLSGLFPALFDGASHSGADWQAVTGIMVQQPGSKALGQLIFDLSPMVYGYSLPLFFGLAMATHLTPWQRTLQCLIVLPVLWLVQTFGMITGALKLVVFDAGSQGAAAAKAAGLSPDVVALCYQFGYLILPAVVPVVLWILLNRRFIDKLGRSEDQAHEEPAAP